MSDKYEEEIYAYKIIKRPLLTEKSNRLLEQNKYVFEVAKEANKFQIKQAIEKIFGVNVVKVNTLNQRGKPRRIRFQIGKRPDWKKAIVTIEKGQSIPIFEGV
jgi:large subunit ribosomal protein L23